MPAIAGWGQQHRLGFVRRKEANLMGFYALRVGRVTRLACRIGLSQANPSFHALDCELELATPNSVPKKIVRSFFSAIDTRLGLDDTFGGDWRCTARFLCPQ